jgi:hypothetical protein
VTRFSTRAFSSEVDTGSREENASKQESRDPFRFNRNGKSSGAPRFASSVFACAALLLLAATPSHAAAKIQRLVSPGGIEAWFVQDATVPVIAMEYAFGGGSNQDPAGKSGVGNMVAGLRRDDFRVFEDKIEQKIMELSADPRPLSVVVLVDNDMKQKDADQVDASLPAILAGMSLSDEADV